MSNQASGGDKSPEDAALRTLPVAGFTDDYRIEKKGRHNSESSFPP